MNEEYTLTIHVLRNSLAIYIYSADFIVDGWLGAITACSNVFLDFLVSGSKCPAIFLSIVDFFMTAKKIYREAHLCTRLCLPPLQNAILFFGAPKLQISRLEHVSKSANSLFG